MKNMLKILKVDLYKAIISIPFLFSVIGVAFVYYLVAKPEISPNIDIMYIFRNSIEWIGTYHLTVILMCTLPFSASFCKEWNSKNIKFNIIRSNISKYSWSKFITCSLVGGLTIALGTLLFIVVMLNFMPLITEIRLVDNDFYYTLGGELLDQRKVGMYMSIYILLRFLYGAFWASIGLLFSAYIPNVFVALSSPFILSYIYRILAYKLPIYVRLEHIANGTMGNFINNNMIHTLVYSILIFIILIIIVGGVFQRKVRWRVENE